MNYEVFYSLYIYISTYAHEHAHAHAHAHAIGNYSKLFGNVLLLCGSWLQI